MAERIGSPLMVTSAYLRKLLKVVDALLFYRWDGLFSIQPTVWKQTVGI